MIIHFERFLYILIIYKTFDSVTTAYYDGLISKQDFHLFVNITFECDVFNSLDPVESQTLKKKFFS